MAQKDAFQQWLQTPHGKEVYGLFVMFAAQWRQAGKDKCAASLLVNRLRWEVNITSPYSEFKVSNNFAPMMARQLATDDPSFRPFFNFHGSKDVVAA